jgi:AcrR family transcriptional regulator
MDNEVGDETGQRDIRIAGGARNPARRPRPAAKRQGVPRVTQSSEAYFEVAFRLLAAHGPAGVTVASCCDALGVTKGSFYYYFTDMAEFAEAFAEYWETSTAAMLAAATTADDPLERLGGLISALADLSHEAEAALRAWGHSNRDINLARSRADDQLEAATAAILGEILEDPATAGQRARQVLGLAVGLQHRRRPIDRHDYLTTLAGLIEVVCGVQASIDDAEGPSSVRVRFRRREESKPRARSRTGSRRPAAGTAGRKQAP